MANGVHCACSLDTTLYYI